MLEEFATQSAYPLNVAVSERAWRESAEFFGCPERTRTALGIEQAYDPLHFQRFGGQRSPRSLPGGIFHFPAFGDQTEEAALVIKSRLDRQVGQVMQSEMRSVFCLLLPGYRTILAGAPQHARTICPLGYFNL